MLLEEGASKRSGMARIYGEWVPAQAAFSMKRSCGHQMLDVSLTHPVFCSDWPCGPRELSHTQGLYAYDDPNDDDQRAQDLGSSPASCSPARRGGRRSGATRGAAFA